MSSLARARRRIPAHVLVPLIVSCAVIGLLLVSARAVLTPAVPVRYAPVVFDREPDAHAQHGSGAPAAQRSSSSVQAPGWLEADPFAVACTALADGVVDSVLVLEGQRVEKGQTVATLVKEDAELALARAEADLRAAEAELAVARADLAAAQTDWDNPIDRDRAVGVSHASLAETEAELAQLPALIAAEQAAVERLREEHARAKNALDAGAANDIEVIILLKQAEAQEATVLALRERRPILEAQRDRLAAEARAADRHAELRITERRALDAARAQLARAEAAAMQARSARDEAALRLQRMTVLAPLSGLVQRRLKAPGDKVMLAMDDPLSSQLLLIYDPAKIQVRVDVPLADARHVFVGQRCEVVVDVLPDQTFAGEVTRVTHEADLQKNTLQVKVRVIDPSPLLKPEMLTRVKFLPGDPAAQGANPGAAPARAGVLVPGEGIVTDGAGSFVWAVRERRAERGVAKRVPVSVLSSADGWARVTGELFPGDLLALDHERLSQGRTVRLTAPKGGDS